jgi:hypothetical protein
MAVDSGAVGAASTSRLVRLLLVVAGTLVATIGIPLVLFSEQTDVGFAWTIQPPITAAFLGGAYWASATLEFLSARERRWMDARIAVPAVLAFTVLTLIVTVVHLGRFHLGSAEPLARLVAWAWLAVYAGFPLVLGPALVLQLRARRAASPRTERLPSWFRGLLVIQGVALGGAGVWLMLAPEAAAPLWAWSLTALTGRAIGAWLIGLAIISLQMAWEDEWARLRPAVAASGVFVVLQVVAIVRFGSVADWSRPLGLLLLAVLASMTVVTVVGLPRAWRAPARGIEARTTGAAA